jgi:hypothetical protein
MSADGPWHVGFSLLDSSRRYLTVIRKGEPFYTSNPEKAKKFPDVVTAKVAARKAERWLCYRHGLYGA